MGEAKGRPLLISVLYVIHLGVLHGRDYPEVTIIFRYAKCTPKDKREFALTAQVR